MTRNFKIDRILVNNQFQRSFHSNPWEIDHISIFEILNVIYLEVKSQFYAFLLKLFLMFLFCEKISWSTITRESISEEKILKIKDIEPWINGTIQIKFTKDVRVTRAIGNDSVNDILLLTTAVFSDDISCSSTRIIIYDMVYLFARIFYTTSYFIALQSRRTLEFYVGQLYILTCNLDLIIIH